MSKTKLVRFTVEGVGVFPFDMLRYDGCYPVGHGDVRIMTHISSSEEPKRVELESFSAASPTPARWESFGWRVVEPAA